MPPWGQASLGDALVGRGTEKGEPQGLDGGENRALRRRSSNTEQSKRSSTQSPLGGAPQWARKNNNPNSPNNPQSWADSISRNEGRSKDPWASLVKAAPSRQKAVPRSQRGSGDPWALLTPQEPPGRKEESTRRKDTGHTSKKAAESSWNSAFDLSSHLKPANFRSRDRPRRREEEDEGVIDLADKEVPQVRGWGASRARHEEEDAQTPDTRRKPRHSAQPQRPAVRRDDEWDVGETEYYDDVQSEGWEKLRQDKRREKEARQEAKRRGQAPKINKIFIPEYISVSDLAHALSVRPNGFLATLQELGFDGLHAESLFTGETAGLVAQEFGYQVMLDDGATRDVRPRPPPEDPPCPPPSFR